MSFIIIMIAWALVQHWGSGTPVQRDHWFDDWYQRVKGGVSQPVAVVAITLLLPCLGLMLLADWFQHLLFGLVYMGLGVLTLLYSFGRGDFGELVSGFTQRWRRTEYEGAYLYACESLGIDQYDTDNNTDPSAVLAEVNREILYRGYERWFAVIFYFLLAGFAGALIYRLVHLLQERADSPEEREANGLILMALDWIPVRILALAFAVTGNFVQTMEPLVESLRDWQQSARGVLVETSAAALGVTGTSVSSDAFSRTIDLQKLLHRSAAGWIAALALFTILI